MAVAKSILIDSNDPPESREAGASAAQRHDRAKANLSFLLERALADGVLTRRELVEGLTVRQISERLSQHQLSAVVQRALELGRAHRGFTESELLQIVPAAALLDGDIPFTRIWETAVVPKLTGQPTSTADTAPHSRFWTEPLSPPRSERDVTPSRSALSSSEPDAAPPPSVGGYSIVRRLATGGMAEVFLARATGVCAFRKLVALKRILPAVAHKRKYVLMFRDEVRIMALLDHPNIVRILDYGLDEHSHYFTMEYVDGQTLSWVVNTSRRLGRHIPFECAVSIIARIAEGLHHAHEMTDCEGELLQLVHRDISHKNVLVTWGGGVKIIDFGVAKALRRETTTQARILKGRIGYMSPEQCLGEEIDRRTDVFALGVLLYELTTMSKLFYGSDYEILKQTTQADIPLPSSRRRRYPPGLEAIVMRALCRSKNDRYQTASAMFSDLEQLAARRRWNLSQARVRELICELHRIAGAKISHKTRDRESASVTEPMAALFPGHHGA